MYTTLITSSFRKAHPSTKIIETTLKSLRIVMPDVFDNPIVIAQDQHDDKKYEEYLNNLKELVRSEPLYRNVKIVYNDSPVNRSLVSNLEHALQFVPTKYVWVLQDDLLFFKAISLPAIMADMESNGAIKYVRTTIGAPPMRSIAEPISFVSSHSDYTFEEDRVYDHESGIIHMGRLRSGTDSVMLQTFTGVGLDELTSWDYGPPFPDVAPFDTRHVGGLKKGKEYNYIEATLYSDLVFFTTKEYLTSKVLGSPIRAHVDVDGMSYPEGFMARITGSDPEGFGIHVLAETTHPFTTCLHLDGRNSTLS